MGSYDTGEFVSMPQRQRYQRPAEERTMPTLERPAPALAEYDPGLKTIVALGGGLTPDRIVQPLPEEYRTKSIKDVVTYLMGDEVATRPEDRTIVDAIKERMTKPDYRLIINNTRNLENTGIEHELTGYLRQKSQETESGELKFNFADIAIVSHDEGGRGYATLEKKL